MKNKQTKKMSIFALFIALEIVMSIFPFLGFIPLGFINATTLHIPVIIASIILGKKEGVALGFLFGLLSLIKATLEPNLTSFVFSPFITIGDVSGNFASLLIVFLPRMLMGYMSGFIFEKLKDKQSINISVGVSAFIGSMCNTIFVLLGILVFFKDAYANAIGISVQGIFIAILSLIATSGVIEAIVAVIFSLLIYKAVKKAFKF